LSTKKQTRTYHRKGRGRGRQPITAVVGAPYLVRLPPALAERLRRLGDGSLSRGIIIEVAGADEVIG
jgi:hypothetical protein